MKFKIRCSAIGSIMAGTVGASPAQLDNIAKMEAREKPMTGTQQVKYNKDKRARDYPDLPAGAKTYCKKWLAEQLYNRRKEINTKYMDKGNICEDWSIKFLNAKLLTNYKKNEDFKQDEWMQGTCDINDANKIIDIKNSFEFSTFPLFDTELKNKDYEWQLQGYMNLWEKDNAEVIYTLMDLPDFLIEREAKSLAYQKNCDIDEVYEEVKAYHTYDDVPTKLRYKRFEVKRDDKKIQQIKDRVELCQKYVNELMEGLA